jgi:uncharacterized protein
MVVVNEIGTLLQFVWEALVSNWWLIALSVPLAVLARISGIGQKAKNVLQRHQSASIVIATLFGAFSPLCSCSVIPVVFALLTAGVPLAPIMSFWVASPSMDPEILFLSAAMLGWPLAIARLVATLAISLSAGYITVFLGRRGLFADVVQREYRSQRVDSLLSMVWRRLRRPQMAFVAAPATSFEVTTKAKTPKSESCSSACGSAPTPAAKRNIQWQTVLSETASATVFVGKFVLLAFFLEAVIIRYVPQTAIASTLGASSALAPLWATLAGIPLYTTSIASLGLIGGLLEQGMSEGAALSFLIAGPTTTIPAMAAVYNVVSKQVFILYLSIPTVSALVIGIAWQVFG